MVHLFFHPVCLLTLLLSAVAMATTEVGGDGIEWELGEITFTLCLSA